MSKPTEEYSFTALGDVIIGFWYIKLKEDNENGIHRTKYLTLVNHFREQKTTEEELDNFLEKHVGEGNSAEYIHETLFKTLVFEQAYDYHQHFGERMTFLMSLYDKDGDGFVSELDLCEAYASFLIYVLPGRLNTIFQKLDGDNDGKLSVEEFEQLGRSVMNMLFIRKDELPRQAKNDKATKYPTQAKKIKLEFDGAEMNWSLTNRHFNIIRQGPPMDAEKALKEMGNPPTLIFPFKGLLSDVGSDVKLVHSDYSGQEALRITSRESVEIVDLQSAFKVDSQQIYNHESFSIVAIYVTKNSSPIFLYFMPTELVASLRAILVAPR